jgi:uncharacterized membrane protein
VSDDRSAASTGRAAQLLHAALIGATVVCVLAGGPVSAGSMALSVILALPLLVAIPGVLRPSRRARQWLAILLVLYAGGFSAEVVAQAGSLYAGLGLCVALMELAALLILLRRRSG